MLGTLRSIIAVACLAVSFVIIRPLLGKDGVGAEEIMSELFASKAFVLLLIGTAILIGITFLKNVLGIVVGIALAIGMMAFANQSVGDINIADTIQKKVLPCTGQASIEIVKSGGDYLAKVINPDTGSDFTSPVKLEDGKYIVVDQSGNPIQIPGCQG